MLAFEDLRLEADLILERNACQLGDTMQFTVHLRDGGEPVTGATMRVLLEAPTRAWTRR